MSEQDHSGMQPTTTTYMAETGPSGIKPAGLDLRGYELIDELGKGGMGAVYRCCDPALDRDLAIKVMRAEFQNHSEVERRFVREARVTGSLQHPGIVPIHNLGQLPDGRLHYTMRLVRGRTFADILKEEAGKPECLPSLLAIFEKVCEAAAYAHSKRVIHRDLKPANIMVGKFGEVQVMDWGLAKLLTAEGEPAEEEPRLEPGLSLIHTEAADTPSDLTRSGTSIGTPAYMAPEQALGDWELVDERADVFALGAILCAILTGEPPYSGSEDMDMLRRARRGELEDAWARLELCAADAALTTLCRECLSVDCSKRPRDAGVAALRVAAYQAEVEKRLRQAELERTEAEVKTREERKRRRVVVKLSAVVLFVFIVGALFSTRFALDARRQAEDAENQKTRADDNAKQAEQEKQLALQAREQAEQTLIEGLLRPIDPSGSRDSSLNAAEREAFTSLHSLQSDHIRMRFFEEGLRTAEKARRLDRRAAWVIQAAVGLNAGRRKQVKELLMHRLRDREAPLEVRAACVMLGIALDIQDAAFDESVRETVLSLVVNSIRWNTFEDLTERLKVASEHLDSDSSAKAVDLIANAISTSTDEDIPSFGMLLEALASMSGALNTASAEKVADLIVTAMTKTTDAEVLSRLSNGLVSVSARLDSASAAKVADRIVTAMSKTIDLDVLRELSDDLASVSGRLDAAAAASHAAKAADLLVAAMSKTTDPNVLSGLSNDLAAVSERLDAADAASHAAKAADLLVATMSKSTDFSVLSWLSNGLASVSGRLDAADAAKTADLLVAAMSKTTDPNVLSGLSNGLASVSERLDAAAAAKVADLLVAAMTKTTDLNVLSGLSRGLAWVSEHLDAAAATKTADRLLNAMSKINDFKVLGWLASALASVSEGLDSASAAKAADLLLNAMNKINDQNIGLQPWIAQAISQRSFGGIAGLSGQGFNQLGVGGGGLGGIGGIAGLGGGGLVGIGGIAGLGGGGGIYGFGGGGGIYGLGGGWIGQASFALSNGLESVSQRLDTPSAAKLLMTVMSKHTSLFELSTLNSQGWNSQGWLDDELPGGYQAIRGGYQAITERCSTIDLLVFLHHPLAAGPAQRFFLDALGRRTRMHFRNTWHFLDWARSNGIDFVPAN